MGLGKDQVGWKMSFGDDKFPDNDEFSGFVMFGRKITNKEARQGYFIGNPDYKINILTEDKP